MENEKTENKEILKCDHCGIIKLCHKEIYNKFGNVVFICDNCIERSKHGHIPKVLLK